MTPVDPATIGGCEGLGPGPDGIIRTAVEPGDSAAIEVASAPAEVGIRRFADTTEASLGELQPGRPAALAFPADSAPEPWQVSVTGPSARICSIE